MNNNQYYFQDIKEQLENKWEQYHISKSKICFNSDNLEKFKLYDQPHVIQDIDIIKTLDINIKPDFYVIGDDIYQSIENILYYNFIRLVRSDGTVLKKEYIEKLKELGVREVHIQESVNLDEEQISILREEIEQTFFHKVKEVLENHMYQHSAELAELSRRLEELKEKELMLEKNESIMQSHFHNQNDSSK